MYHLSQLQPSIRFLSTIIFSLHHIVMLFILLYYATILKESIVFVNKEN